MGEVAETEKLKLRASFYNNLATGLIITGYVVPYFAFLQRTWNDPHFGSFAGLLKIITSDEMGLLTALWIFTILGAWLLRRVANSVIEKIED